jgi:hypothetical protein
MSFAMGDPSRGPNPLLRFACFHVMAATSTGAADGTANEAPGAIDAGGTDGDCEAAGSRTAASATSASAVAVTDVRIGRCGVVIGVPLAGPAVGAPDASTP